MLRKLFPKNSIREIDQQILDATQKRLEFNQAEKVRTGLYPLEMVLFYITMRCNAKCKHCFCAEDLNIGLPEFSLEEIEKIAQSMPRIRLLVLTGGEPTLRQDLPEIFRIFARHDKAETILINTNGLKPKKIAEMAVELKSEFPNTGLEIQVSLDGLEATHDEIRAVPGNFKKSIDTLGRIYALKNQYPGLNAHALTVICDKNYGELVALNDFLREHIDPDFHQGFEMVRDVEKTAWNIPRKIKESNVGPPNMDLPPLDAFPHIAADLKTINDRGPYRANAYHIHNLAQLKMIETGKEQFKCVTAGQSVAVVYTTGDVAHCEFTLPFANLKDHDFNFEELWLSDAAYKRRKQITTCHCTHGCFHGKAVEYHQHGIDLMKDAAIGKLDEY